MSYANGLPALISSSSGQSLSTAACTDEQAGAHGNGSKRARRHSDPSVEEPVHTTAVSPPNILPPPKAVYVKVDGGSYLRPPSSWDELAFMDARAVLTVLTNDEVLKPKMAEMLKLGCQVTVVPNITAGGRVPTATDEKDAVLVDGPVTIGELAGA
ncbi:MAG: hypothetical protein EOO65_03205, partial [Methanosarcinales archaeon]